MLNLKSRKRSPPQHRRRAPHVMRFRPDARCGSASLATPQSVRSRSRMRRVCSAGRRGARQRHAMGSVCFVQRCLHRPMKGTSSLHWSITTHTILLATLIELGLMISRAENPDQAEAEARRALSDLLDHTLFQRTRLRPRPPVAKPRRRPGQLDDDRTRHD
jgi:hypothetical protein